MLECRADGTVSIPILRLNRTRDERENYLQTRNWLSRNLMPRREPGDDITQAHRDVAAALQAALNRAILHICGHFGASTGLRKIAMAGGVALNCSANGKLTRSGLFDEIYVQPAAGDDGAALGAALHRASMRRRGAQQEISCSVARAEPLRERDRHSARKLLPERLR